MHESSAMIEIKNLAFQYQGQSFCLQVPDLVIPQGQKCAFVGPSGCGKTTLVYLIAGIYQPRSGSIHVQGERLTGQSDRQLRNYRISKIGFIFQQFELLDYLNVRENIILPNLINPALGRVPEKAVVRLAEGMGLSDKLARYPAQLSQGEKQRVAICRALVNEPDIIIADEPTGNLDPQTTHSIMELIQAQVRLRKCTFLMVTHDYSLLNTFDRVIDFQDFEHRIVA